MPVGSFNPGLPCCMDWDSIPCVKVGGYRVFLLCTFSHPGASPTDFSSSSTTSLSTSYNTSPTGQNLRDRICIISPPPHTSFLLTQAFVQVSLTATQLEREAAMPCIHKSTRSVRGVRVEAHSPITPPQTPNRYQMLHPGLKCLQLPDSVPLILWGDSCTTVSVYRAQILCSGPSLFRSDAMVTMMDLTLSHRPDFKKVSHTLYGPLFLPLSHLGYDWPRVRMRGGSGCSRFSNGQGVAARSDGCQELRDWSIYYAVCINDRFRT